MDRLGYRDSLSFEDIFWFNSQFISLMRREEDVVFTPTCRQAISIPNLLSSRYLRNGRITPDDLARAAIVTSQPEDQATAYRIAMEILFGGRKDKNEEATRVLLSDHRANSGTGGGEQLYKEWKEKYRAEYQGKLLADLERIMMRSDSQCEYQIYTRERNGRVEGEKMSPFRWGDDPECLDFEESLENLLLQGKDPALARHEDLIIRQKKCQRKAVVILLDISGSMFSALKYMKLCGAMLLLALQKNEVALAFFESNDYVIKRFFDKMQIEKAVSSLLSARAMMGTMGEGALSWARKQLNKVDGRYCDRECIVMSDFGFHDIEKVTVEIEQLMRMDVKVILVLPPVFIHRSQVEKVRKSGCSIVEMDRESMEKSAKAILGAI